MPEIPATPQHRNLIPAPRPTAPLSPLARARRAWWWHVVSEIPPLRRRCDRPIIEEHYRQWFGRLPDLDHPKRLSEKIAWRMLHGYEPLHARLTDRLGLREFVRERIGSECLPRLIASGRSAKALSLDALSEPCVLKVNNGCGGHVFVRDPRTLDRQAAAAYLDGLLHDNHYPRKREYHYKKIRPRLLAEELLLDHDGQLPSDFKFFMFSGEIGMLWVDIDRFGQHRRAIFDGDLDRIPYRFRGVRDDQDFRLPAAIDAMRDVARRLAGDIDFVRVDLYDLGDRILVGEMTFTPGAGVILVNSPELDLEYGARWKLAASGHPDAAATPGRRRYEVPA